MTKDTIIIHTLDVRPDWMQGRPVEEKVAEVARWHVDERGWAAIGYAMIIDRDGSLGKGRDLDGDGDVYEETGAQAKGWNKRSIGVALVGGYGGKEYDQFSDHYTEEQRTALWGVIDDIEARFGNMKIIGHNEAAAKDCPCFSVPEFLAEGRVEPHAKTGGGVLAALIAFIAKLIGGKK